VCAETFPKFFIFLKRFVQNRAERERERESSEYAND
jgi:hypothetical protein